MLMRARCRTPSCGHINPLAVSADIVCPRQLLSARLAYPEKPPLWGRRRATSSASDSTARVVEVGRPEVGSCEASLASLALEVAPPLLAILGCQRLALFALDVAFAIVEVGVPEVLPWQLALACCAGPQSLPAFPRRLRTAFLASDTLNNVSDVVGPELAPDEAPLAHLALVKLLARGELSLCTLCLDPLVHAAELVPIA